LKTYSSPSDGRKDIATTNSKLKKSKNLVQRETTLLASATAPLRELQIHEEDSTLVMIVVPPAFSDLNVSTAVSARTKTSGTSAVDSKSQEKLQRPVSEKSPMSVQ